MSGATKISGELQAGTSGTTDSSAMETEEYYNPEGGEWSQKVDTGQLCRVCANPNEYLIPIFDGEGLEHELSVKIEKHLPIKVTETDALPQQMCYQCASTLIAWHDLVLNCVEADKKLRELQADEDDDDDDKGAEMFESHSMDSDPADEVDQPSTSESQITAKLQVPKKTVLSKDKKPKLKMVLVKGSLAGTSGQKTVAKTQVAKALELAKSKEGGNEDSASERCCRLSKSQLKILGHNEDTKGCVVSVLTQHEVPIVDVLDDLSAYEVFKLKNVSQIEDDFEDGDSGQLIGYPESEIQPDYDEHLESYLQDNEYVSEQLDDLDSQNPNTPLYRCQHCGQEFTCSSTLKLHLKTDHKKLIEHRCRVCNEIFPSRNKLQNHRITHDPSIWNELEITHLCHTCGKTFNTSSKLRCHEKRVHQRVPVILLGEKKHICEVCGLAFQFNKYLRKHILKHGEKNFVCETCGKRFETNYKLKMHQECHSEQRPYACKICGSAYKRHRNLLSHEQEVHGIFSLGPGKVKESLSFPCGVCKKEFTTPKRVAAHMRTHTGERPYSCEHCGHSFRIYSSLLFHRRVVHEGRKIYGNKGVFPCEVCGKVFSTKQYRDIHLRIHKGEKPYVCKICNRAFTQRTSLVNHSALHSDHRPYPCHLCEKAFRRRETLIIHIRTHTGEKPHVCEVCGRGFAQLTDMKKHRLKIHNVVVPRKT